MIVGRAIASSLLLAARAARPVYMNVAGRAAENRRARRLGAAVGAVAVAHQPH